MDGTTSGGVPALQMVPGGSLQLEGDSTLHRYHARATRFTAEARIDAARVAAARESPTVEALIRDHAVTAFALVAAANGLSSGHSGLDANMRSALKSDQHPLIRFDMSAYELAPPKRAGSLFEIVLHGRLSLAGVVRNVDVHADAFRTRDGVRFTGARDLLMTDYGIKPPRLMLGALKTADLVTVKFDVIIRLVA